MSSLELPTLATVRKRLPSKRCAQSAVRPRECLPWEVHTVPADHERCSWLETNRDAQSAVRPWEMHAMLVDLQKKKRSSKTIPSGTGNQPQRGNCHRRWGYPAASVVSLGAIGSRLLIIRVGKQIKKTCKRKNAHQRPSRPALATNPFGEIAKDDGDTRPQASSESEQQANNKINKRWIISKALSSAWFVVNSFC